MKKYTIGLITGALLAVSAMMFMGSNKYDNQVGRFVQMSKFRILDTTNGSVWHSGDHVWYGQSEDEKFKTSGWVMSYESVFESEDRKKVILYEEGKEHTFIFDQ